ncbi:uncharacterized protein LOC132696996 isoform X3 [Cylas formicarius]|nr:uncharacterized protein LOC132696996 isoform X3 [Cylas formicarius]
MPPVRWKYVLHVMAIFVHAASATDAQYQDAISMSSDGWRPIVGTRRHQTNFEPELSRYSNAGPNVDFSRAEVVSVDATTPSYQRSSVSIQRSPIKDTEAAKQGSKFKHVPNKVTNTYYALPASHHIPLTSNYQHSRPLQMVKKHSAVKKQVTGIQAKPRKPARGPVVAHTSRDEVFVPAPNTGTFSLVKSVSPNLGQREAGSGLFGGNQFGFNQPNAHIEFTNRFSPSGAGNAFQRPVFFAKPFDTDVYTRNLVPPPRSSNAHKGNLRQNNGLVTEATSNFEYFGNNANRLNSQQISSFGSHFGFNLPTKNNELAVDVQVTKENVKQFPGSFPQQSNFDLLSTNPPKPLTYEVTEGKWLDSQDIQYRPRNQPFLTPPNKAKIQSARPGLLFQDASTPSPPIIQAPLVDLSVPAFLPTPYKPENSVVPTSPTRDDVSTIFSQVSKKMNKHRHNALKTNPLFFNINEVSTHYPILGVPEVDTEPVTEIQSGINENIVISDERGQQRARPTQATTQRDPTKTRISNRRRPRPKRPTTTTTTEETVVDTYEPVRSDEMENEPPPRRRRPRPTQQRVREQEEVTSEPPVERKPTSHESSTKLRGRYRYKVRGRNPTSQSNDVGGNARPKERPNYPERIVQKTVAEPKYTQDTSEVSVEQNSVEGEISSSYSDESSRQQESEEQHDFGRFRGHTTAQPFIEEIRTSAAPENEVDYTTTTTTAATTTVEEEYVTQAVGTTPPSTTTETRTTKSSRIRNRLNKFNASNRPRFSVKDYRQKLDQLTSTTPTTTTESRRSTQSIARLRFPSRLRGKTGATSTATINRIDEDSTEQTTTLRTRFKPKEPRHQATTESDVTTEETTTTKVSIKPNLFSARRRAQYPNLKARIQNKTKKSEDEETTTTEEATNPTEVLTTESTTPETTSKTTEETTTTEDIMKTDALMYSQRVSDLTSSFKDEYDTPGLFKSVSPTSRRIPSYFTISTDDPILPIEAFFPKLKDGGERTASESA